MSDHPGRPGTPQWDALIERLRAKTLSLPVPKTTPEERQAVRESIASQMRSLGATDEQVHRFLHGPPPTLLDRLRARWRGRP